MLFDIDFGVPNLDLLTEPVGVLQNKDKKSEIGQKINSYLNILFAALAVGVM